ncbi:MAG: T9SS type A sorting domain-containing protein [Cyclobacteriaceae bacterium]|nr:T9SS type A sorting domain-containing protein [Cyclobacteriaceae bacterium]
MSKCICLLLMSIVNCQLLIVNCYAQEIPLGTWRMHNSYNSIHTIAFGSGTVYGASANGLVIVNSDNSLTTLTKLDGLSGVDITSIAVDATRNQLLIAYADGMLDIVHSNEIISFSGLKESPTISGSRRINHINLLGELAYLSADYGVVVFDLNQLQVKETWRDLGPAGQVLAIRQSNFLGDSIFLATQQGVLAGLLTDNLLDFANWTRYNQGAFNATVESVSSFNGTIFAAIDGAGLYRKINGSWTLEHFPGADFNTLTADSHLFIIEGSNLWMMNASGTLVQLQDEKITQPLYAVHDAAGKYWIGDANNGLLSDRSGSFQSYLPNGPTFSGGFRFALNNTNQLFAVSGGYTGTTPAGKNEKVNSFNNGQWKTEGSYLTSDVTDIDFSSTTTFVASFGAGLQAISNGTSVTYTNSNSPLSTNRITALAYSNDGLWVTNYGTSLSLHLLKSNNTWESFSFPIAAASFPTELVVDGLGQVWMVLNPSQGGGIVVFNRTTNQHVYLNEQPGSGSLPSRSVFSIASDRNGQVWVGTNAGVAYFPNPSQMLSGNVNSVKPIFNGRFLLRDETSTAIAVDGGNRKWIGTQRGVWLFNAFGEEHLQQFNVPNSPLLSDQFIDIAVHPITGEVFFLTDHNVVSYRSDATMSQPVFDKVKIFPNPVTADFTGRVSISGLSTDATVKITDVSGKMVWQTFANGGTATWDVRDYTGRRAATGMYLVIAIAQDGQDSIVGKIAVVN